MNNSIENIKKSKQMVFEIVITTVIISIGINFAVLGVNNELGGTNESIMYISFKYLHSKENSISQIHCSQISEVLREKEIMCEIVDLRDYRLHHVLIAESVL